MVTVACERLISVPVSHVWSALSDFGAMSEWATNLDDSCLTGDQPAGVGMARRVQTERETLIETVTAWEPETLLSYDVAGISPMLQALQFSWALAVRGETTLVTLSADIGAGQRTHQKLIAHVEGRKLAPTLQALLNDLARVSQRNVHIEKNALAEQISHNGHGLAVENKIASPVASDDE